MKGSQESYIVPWGTKVWRLPDGSCVPGTSNLYSQGEETTAKRKIEGKIPFTQVIVLIFCYFVVLAVVVCRNSNEFLGMLFC